MAHRGSEVEGWRSRGGGGRVHSAERLVPLVLFCSPSLCEGEDLLSNRDHAVVDGGDGGAGGLEEERLRARAVSEPVSE